MTSRRAIPIEVADSVLADSSRVVRPRVPRPGPDQRIHTRFDKMLVVGVASEMYGDCDGIARNVSTGGILIEMPYAPPMGSVLRVQFRCLRGDDSVDRIEAAAEVKHHHYLNYADSRGATTTRAIGLRFVDFVASNSAPPADDDAGLWH